MKIFRAEQGPNFIQNRLLIFPCPSTKPFVYDGNPVFPVLRIMVDII